MAKTFAELNREIEALKVQAEAARQKEKAGVVDRIRDAIAVYGLTAEELGFGHKTGTRLGAKGGDSSTTAKPAAEKALAKGATASVKYRDEAGNTWGGRGPKPNWLKAGIAKGRALESFAVGKSFGVYATKSDTSSTRPLAKQGQTESAKREKAFKSVIKYRDGSGHTWSGRGPKPAWFMDALNGGKTPEQLAV